jgi:triacylglycerol lipase
MLGVTEDFSWRNATIFAKASFYAYNNPESFGQEFPDATFISNKGSDCYVWKDGDNTLVVFRGTQPTQWSDIKADLKFRKVESVNKLGFVHRGFHDALDVIWPQLTEAIRNKSESPNTKSNKLWFAGHSLGGALATLAAGRYNNETIRLYTYGSPRVCGKKFPKGLKFNHRYRFRNNNDIVARVPPEWLGYQHISANGGNFIYFDSRGLPHKGFSRMFMLKHWWLGLWRGFFQDKTWDSFQDHDISIYYRLCREKMIEDVPV